MVVWFLVIAALGVMGIASAPQVAAALNPLAGLKFLAGHGIKGVLVTGSVVLCFSGTEALFADLGHFARLPIRLAWYGLALPALVLNYFGQGAFVLGHPSAVGTPFYSLVPSPVLLPMVILCTLATIIASQAVISGAFSLTEQATNLGFFPRLRVRHTSSSERGQVYVSVVNWMLMFACLVVVLVFRSSDRLSSAYGLAVIATMTTTSITYFVVMRQVWGWSIGQAAPLAAGFLAIDLLFLAGNVSKIFSGAWIPLLVAAVVLAIYCIWTVGHERFLAALHRLSMPMEEFIRKINEWKQRTEGTAVFLTGHPASMPLMRGSKWLWTNARHQRLVLLTIIQQPAPFVPSKRSIEVIQLAQDFFQVKAQFGFMQQPDVRNIFRSEELRKLTIDDANLVFYLSEANVTSQGGLARQSVQRVYDFLSRNSLSAVDYFRIPPEKVIHVGMALEV